MEALPGTRARPVRALRGVGPTLAPRACGLRCWAKPRRARAFCAHIRSRAWGLPREGEGEGEGARGAKAARARALCIRFSWPQALLCRPSERAPGYCNGPQGDRKARLAVPRGAATLAARSELAIMQCIHSRGAPLRAEAALGSSFERRPPSRGRVGRRGGRGRA